MALCIKINGMQKLDLRTQYKYLYQPSTKKVELVELPTFQFAMIDGEIEPGHGPGTSPAFQQALEALYGISYTLKFASKLRKIDPIDYAVMPLEGLWWVNSGWFDISKPDNWRWTAMIMQPEPIDEEMFQNGLAQLRKKKPGVTLDRLRLETFWEGLSMQIMHVGPYAEEPATLAKMDAFARENGYGLCGKHHVLTGRPTPLRSGKAKNRAAPPD